MLLLAAILCTAAAPDVYLISVDTLRADHLSCYGYTYNTSPNIDRLAESSLVFEDFVCEVPLTGPSFAAMMTSLYPRMIGTTRNGIRVPEWAPTVAEHFKAAGYATAAVQSNWTLKADLSALDRGFDHYDDEFDTKRWGLLKAERLGDEVAELSLEVLRTRDPNVPLFAWFHFSDPHAPYKFHKDFNPWGTVPRKLDEVESVRARYDSEIAFTDSQIARVLAELPKENAFIVFVGDHGESLYEHDYLGHGRRIYQNNMHVPFMIHGPGIQPGRSDAPTRGIDVGPTLLKLAGITPHEKMLGLDLAGPLPTDRTRVVETYGGAVPQVAGVRSFLEDRPPMRQGALMEGWKLIVLGPDVELYNLEADPGELENQAKAFPDKVDELTEIIETWSELTSQGESREADLTDDDLEALESLGYLD